MLDTSKETIIQMPLTAEYREKLEAEAAANERTLARQAAWIVKRYYDGLPAAGFRTAADGAAAAGPEGEEGRV